MHLVARADAPAAEGALRAAVRDRARRVALLCHVVAPVALALAHQAPLDALGVAVDPHLLRARVGAVGWARRRALERRWPMLTAPPLDASHLSHSFRHVESMNAGLRLHSPARA
eukprot:scaffold17683_cov69-Phaeocystis_antarctica.AAC.2